jgi:hypothetical protein
LLSELADELAELSDELFELADNEQPTSSRRTPTSNTPENCNGPFALIVDISPVGTGSRIRGWFDPGHSARLRSYRMTAAVRGRMFRS